MESRSEPRNGSIKAVADRSYQHAQEENIVLLRDHSSILLTRNSNLVYKWNWQPMVVVLFLREREVVPVDV